MSGVLVESFKVATVLAAQRIVCFSTSAAYTVQYPDTVTSLPCGVTLDTVLDATQAIPVKFLGVAKVMFNDTVTTGQLVAADNTGKAIPFALAMTSTAISAPAAYAGTLIGPTIGLTGTIADIFIRPGYDRKSA